jgi:hypothetical protein
MGQGATPVQITEVEPRISRMGTDTESREKLGAERKTQRRKAPEPTWKSSTVENSAMPTSVPLPCLLFPIRVYPWYPWSKLLPPPWSKMGQGATPVQITEVEPRISRMGTDTESREKLGAERKTQRREAPEPTWKSSTVENSAMPTSPPLPRLLFPIRVDPWYPWSKPLPPPWFTGGRVRATPVQITEVEPRISRMGTDRKCREN